MLETASEVTVGGGVAFEFSVINAGGTPIELTFRDACRADFAVSETDREVWRYSDGRSRSPATIFLRGENPAVYGVDESGALVRTPERFAFWGRE